MHKKEIIEKILCDAASGSCLEEDLIFFTKNFEYLDNFRMFVFTNDIGTPFPKEYFSNYIDNFDVFNLGFTNKYYYLTKRTYLELIFTEKTNTLFDMCVNLDTNAVSYLKKCFLNPNRVEIPARLINMFNFLNLDNINYDCLPYKIENSLNLNKCRDDVLQNLNSFQHFKYFNYRKYFENKSINYFEPESKIMNETMKQVFSLSSPFFYEISNSFYRTQKMIYALLLKALTIKTVHCKKSADNKFKQLIYFANNELGIILERELTICMYYFQNNQSAREFFAKADYNPNRSIQKTLDNINGMAWDLAHIRIAEAESNILPIDTIELSIIWFLSFDKKLINVLKLCPVKKILIWDKRIQIVYNNTLFQSLDYIYELCFTEDKKQIRRKTLNCLDINKLIISLESKLREQYK